MFVLHLIQHTLNITSIIINQWIFLVLLILINGLLQQFVFDIKFYEERVESCLFES